MVVDNSARSKDIHSRCRGQLITFIMLPDDVLLEIFDFYLKDGFFGGKPREVWIALVHVCRRWRSLVFQSPHRLNLQLVCTPNARARDTLDIWPPLPLIICDDYHEYYKYDKLQDNTIAALEHNDRVCQINFSQLMSSKLESITNSAAMQKPFPELTHLWLGMVVENEPDRILPDSFLARTAPRLRSLKLDEVPYPGILKLLLSTTHLVDLELSDIPPSGYIPPEAMATSLSALTNLESLHLSFLSRRPHPTLGSRRQTPPPLTRSILPSLVEIRYNGAGKYLEEVLARIDAPRVKKLDITFVNEIIFDTAQLFQFISRRPTLMAPEKGFIEFNSRNITFKFQSRTSGFGELSVGIPSTVSEWQLSFIEQICTLSLSPLSTLEDIYIQLSSFWRPKRQVNVENTLWLGLLRPFVPVKNLYLSNGTVPRGIAPALQELLVEAEVLSALENIFVVGFQPSACRLHRFIEKFVTARGLTVSRWDRDGDWDFFG